MCMISVINTEVWNSFDSVIKFEHILHFFSVGTFTSFVLFTSAFKFSIDIISIGY
jgi:hypothetical protein